MYWNLKRRFSLRQRVRGRHDMYWNLKRRFSLRQRVRGRHDMYWNLKRRFSLRQRVSGRHDMYWNLKRRSKVVLSTSESRRDIALDFQEEPKGRSFCARDPGR